MKMALLLHHLCCHLRPESSPLEFLMFLCVPGFLLPVIVSAEGWFESVFVTLRSCLHNF
jgi:hypothetical protein